MSESFFHLCFIGPGGPEFILVMLVLLMMFGAKDAPRILRKLNEIFNQIRNTANEFKREVMYGDLNNESPSGESFDVENGFDQDEDYDYDTEEDYYTCNDEDNDEDLETKKKEPIDEPEDETSEEQEDHVPKD